MTNKEQLLANIKKAIEAYKEHYKQIEAIPVSIFETGALFESNPIVKSPNLDAETIEVEEGLSNRAIVLEIISKSQKPITRRQIDEAFKKYVPGEINERSVRYAMSGLLNKKEIRKITANGKPCYVIANR